MSIASNILKAEHMGIRDVKEHLSMKLLKKRIVITEHGRPVSISIPYEEMLELIDILEELSDPDIVKAVKKARTEYKSGQPGIAVRSAFKRHKTK